MSEIVVITVDELRAIIRKEIEGALRQSPGDGGYLDTCEAAELLGVAEKTVMVWARDRRLRGTKVGRNWKFRRQDVLALVENGSEGGR
ncbi:MAG: helix-turn-helix domain-containing protein [Sandaracinaceae bacterium]|nr:helix-turn-helix domain-containing protein [Sandaracinaceae bacterium]